MRVEELVRDLVKQLVPRQTAPPLRILQGVVVSIQVDNTLTLTLSGGEVEVPGFRYLLDAYTPLVGDVVWILDSGPSSRFVLGASNRP